MGNAYLVKDYKRFTGFMYPGVITKSGGASNMINSLQQADNYMKANGIKLTKVSLDNPLKLVTVGRELQSSIVQHSVIQTANGLVSTSTTLIAFSEDQGINWKFLEAGKKDRIVLKTAALELSPEVEIPAPTTVH